MVTNFLWPIVTRNLHQGVAALMNEVAHEAFVDENAVPNDPIKDKNKVLNSPRFTSLRSLTSINERLVYVTLPPPAPSLMLI